MGNEASRSERRQSAISDLAEEAFRVAPLSETTKKDGDG